MGFLWKAILFAVVVYLLQLISNFIILLQPWKHVYNHAPGPCRYVEGIEHGSEDMQTLSNGLVLITSGLRICNDVGSPKMKHVKGKIFLFDFKKPSDAAVALKIEGDLDMDDFAPHGINIHQDKTGTIHVYVVNHPPSGDTIEKFHFDEKSRRLKHLKTFRDDSAYGVLNDVVVVGDNQFYVSNYLYSRGEPGWTIEFLGGFRWGSLLFYDGNSFKTAAEGFFLANGMAISPDGRYIYMAEPGYRNLWVYERKADNSLVLKEVTNVGTAIDNLDVHGDDIWTGSHPATWQALLYLNHMRDSASSQVLRMRVKDGHLVNVTEVYSDDGHRLHGSTSAIRYGDALLVGTIKSHLMYCELKYIGS